MKTLINGTSAAAVALIGLLAMPPLALPATDGSRNPPEPGDMGSGMGGSQMPMMPMMTQMRQMHEQAARLGASKDPAERREILEQHLQSMRGMMQMMHGMMAGEEMVGHHRDRKRRGMGQGETMPPARTRGDMRDLMGREHHDMVRRMDMMEQRLNLMQLMMDEMLKRQSELLDAR